MTLATTSQDTPVITDRYAYSLGRLQVATERLLAVIDQAPIRKAALACGAELYEAAAMVKDVLADCPRSVSGEPKPDCIYCGHNDHWSQDCQSLDGIAPAPEAES